MLEMSQMAKAMILPYDNLRWCSVLDSLYSRDGRDGGHSVGMTCALDHRRKSNNHHPAALCTCGSAAQLSAIWFL